ncbi:MAG: GTP-binding protein Era [Chitinophagales bacterium]|jgi:GTP-binding protein Era|tara:strand:+ start:13040 stop:13945 length:906 start_codon:yes stop_codon:yes gene_type:complete
MNKAVDGFRCGFIAIVGRPNVGKSTLLNYILEQKISITSRKPQTTRHKILGIKTTDSSQIIYVDTPGIHKANEKAINRYMNKAATSAVRDVDAVVFVIEKLRWTDEDDLVLVELKASKCPVIVVINKVDQLDEKEKLLPYITELKERHDFHQVIAISALHGKNLDVLQESIEKLLPAGVAYYPDDQITDRTERFLVSELVREQIMRQLGDELPYSIAVEIENFKSDGKTIHIDALILVERDGQKAIVIGKGGERLKTIGERSRRDMEIMLDAKVMLKLWVKVRRGWSDDDRALKSLGYLNE